MLLSADEPVMTLQAEAGGARDGPLLVPQLAAIARLAARLGIPLSRPVVAAAGHADIDMWVRARPCADRVELSIVDWQERPPRAQDRTADRDADLLAAGEGWSWQIDTKMQFMAVTAAKIHDGDDLPKPGVKLTRHFQLLADAEGDMPILRAFAERRPFVAQRVVKVDRPIHASGDEWLLSGVPMFTTAGRLTGYRGRAVPVEAASEPIKDSGALYPAMFGKRLDRALRQPLGRIIANADTIHEQREGPLREDYTAYAADIASAGRHLMELVDDLADLQAIDRPDFSVAIEDIDLADIARRTAGLLSVKAVDRDMRFVTPESDDNVPAKGEFRRALQVMVNLVGNAVRYGPQGGTIMVTTEYRAGSACAIVQDEGRGIAVEDRERIFEKFERLGREEAGGSGLGLYISRRLARAMGGDIIVEDSDGPGARFVFSLPESYGQN